MFLTSFSYSPHTMTHSSACRVLALLVVMLVAAGCGDDDGGSSSPTGPGNRPSNPPPSGVALIAGNWNGTSDFQQGGQRFVSNLTATVTQFDRQVEGNIRFTSPGWEAWNATFTGQVAGTSPDTQFTGNVTLLSPSTTGTGTCIGTAVMAGRSINTVMRWEAPSMNLVTNGPTPTPPGGCRGEVFTLVWIFGR
jgi:hypothetical protein